jgi:hypothetical protein
MEKDGLRKKALRNLLHGALSGEDAEESVQQFISLRSI